MRKLGAAPSAPHAVEVTPDGKAAITSGTTGEVMMFPLDGSAPSTLLPSNGRMATSLQFSPDGKHVLVDRDKGVLHVLSLDPIGYEGSVQMLVELAVACREHQHRGPPTRGAQLGADLQPVAAREHQVQDDRAVLVLGRPPEPVDAVVGHVDGIPLGLEPAADAVGQLDLVLDDQHPHGTWLLSPVVPRSA